MTDFKETVFSKTGSLEGYSRFRIRWAMAAVRLNKKSPNRLILEEERKRLTEVMK